MQELDEALVLLDFKSITDLTMSQLKLRYKSKAKEFHPDKTDGDKEKFVELNKAYNLLKTHLNNLSDFGGDVFVRTEEEIDTLDSKIKELDKLLKKNKKNEIMKRYLETEKTLIEHKRSLKKQKQHIIQTKKAVQEIISTFKEKKDALSDELNLSLTDLDERYRVRTYQKVLFFLPRPNVKELPLQRQLVLSEYNKVVSEMNQEMMQQVITLYGSSLNEIQKTLRLIDSAS
jgi:curved DNA-binding protein CbpA